MIYPFAGELKEQKDSSLPEILGNSNEFRKHLGLKKRCLLDWLV